MTNFNPVSKPFSQSSEENKQVILQKIQPLLSSKQTVLEIASGTGQHAVYFAQQMPHLIWQTSDLKESHSGIQLWLNEAGLENVLKPLNLDVSESNWPARSYDAIYSANSFHIMSEQNVTDFFARISTVLNQDAIVMIYGPFNYAGQFTSESNANFNAWLKQRDPLSGIKEFEWCNELAEKAGLKLIEDLEMPVNNRILVWQDSGA